MKKGKISEEGEAFQAFLHCIMIAYRVYMDCMLIMHKSCIKLKVRI